MPLLPCQYIQSAPNESEIYTYMYIHIFILNNSTKLVEWGKVVKVGKSV